MIDRYKDKPTLQWQQMNVTTLDFPDETFDCVIAKGKDLFSLTNKKPSLIKLISFLVHLNSYIGCSSLW